MLKILLKAFIQQAKNYLRDKFDRVTIFYFGLIILMGLYLLGRSPADIGFRLADVNSTLLTQKWSGIFCGLLPFYYIFTEVSVYHSTRASAVNKLLLSLPVPTKTVTDFALLITMVKISGPMLFLSLPLLLGQPTLLASCLQFVSAFGLLAILAFFSWIQITHFQKFLAGARSYLVLWLLLDIAMLACLFALANNRALQMTLLQTFGNLAFATLLIVACLVGYFVIVRFYPLQPREKVGAAIMPGKQGRATGTHFPHSRLAYLMLHDFLYVLKNKKSILFVQLIGVALALMVSIHTA